MKRVYPMVIAISICMTSFLLPRIVSAQCTCSGGLAATAVDYYSSFTPTSASSIIINFPKFNPSIGTLSCLTLKDSLSGITTTNAQNLNPDSTVYKFVLNVAYDIEGPTGGGISNGNSYSKNYGPDTLAPVGTAGDHITYGP